MKLLLALGLLSSVAFLSQAVPHCHLSEFCHCVDIAVDWLHSLPKRSIPETEDDVVVMCNALDKTMDCLFGYRDNCTTPLQKEVIGLVVEGAINLEKEFCTPGSKCRTNYLAHAPCINKISHMDEVKENIEYILAVLEKARSVPEDQFITFACCGYAKVVNSFIKLGRDNCGEEVLDAAQEMLSLAVAQLPEVICGGYDDQEDRCKGILPPAGSKPSDDVKEMEIYKFIRNVLKNWLD